MSRVPLVIPRRPPGGQSKAVTAAYALNVEIFCHTLQEIASRNDFQVSARGWCYILEDAGGLTKGDFDTVENLINDCRKVGLLPVNICADDVASQFACIEAIDEPAPKDEANRIWRTIERWQKNYKPFSFWDALPVYIQMLVEKVDLKSLFEPLCNDFFIPIANGGGWPDLNLRADLMRRFAEKEREGKQCILLYCGDHDPAGLNISEFQRSNLNDMAKAVGWSPDNLIIDRFGLNYDFIMEHRLSWIENLMTSGKDKKCLSNPTHKDHNKPYVQRYLQRYGVRKVEANALVTRPEAGRALCEQAILKWLKDEKAPERYQQELAPYRNELLTALNALLAGQKLTPPR